MPSPASRSPCLAMPSQPGAPSAVQAEQGPDPTQVSSQPDQGFARWGEAAPSPALLGFGLATTLQHRAPPAAQAESGQDPTQYTKLKV